MKRWPRRTKPAKGGAAYRALWRVVDGAVADVVASHPDYFARGRAKDARVSISKRVVGAIDGYARQRARGRSGTANPAAERAGVKPDLAPPEAVDTTSPRNGGGRDLASGGGGRQEIAPAILEATLRAGRSAVRNGDSALRVPLTGAAPPCDVAAVPRLGERDGERPPGLRHEDPDLVHDRGGPRG